MKMFGERKGIPKESRLKRIIYEGEENDVPSYKRMFINLCLKGIESKEKICCGTADTIACLNYRMRKFRRYGLKNGGL